MPRKCVIPVVCVKLGKLYVVKQIPVFFFVIRPYVEISTPGAHAFL